MSLHNSAYFVIHLWSAYRSKGSSLHLMKIKCNNEAFQISMILLTIYLPNISVCIHMLRLPINTFSFSWRQSDLANGLLLDSEDPCASYNSYNDTSLIL